MRCHSNRRQTVLQDPSLMMSDSIGELIVSEQINPHGPTVPAEAICVGY